MDIFVFIKYMAVMAGVTYLIRVVPYLLVRKEVKNKFLKSFLAYVPYAVLAAMTVPALLFETEHMISAVIGLIVGIIVAYFEKGLLLVASSCCVAVLVVELIIKFIG